MPHGKPQVSQGEHPSFSKLLFLSCCLSAVFALQYKKSITLCEDGYQHFMLYFFPHFKKTCLCRDANKLSSANPCSLYPRIQCCGSGSEIRDQVLFWPLDLGSYFRELINNFWVKKILIFFDADPDPGSFWSWIRDGKIRNRDPV